MNGCRSTRWLVFCLFLFSGTLRSVELAEIKRVALNGQLQGSMKVRFESSGRSLLLAASAGAGILKSPELVESTARIVVKRGNAADQLWLVHHLASASDVSVVAAPAFQLRTLGKGFAGVPFDLDISSIEAVDARGAEVAILGLRRDEGEIWPASDGAVAWTTRREASGMSSLNPIAFSLAGPGASTFVACSSLGLGAIRYFADGTILLVPGAEPGAYRIDPTKGGRILATWDLARVNVGAHCTSLTEAEEGEVQGDPHARWRWLNRFETVDDALVFKGEPYLLTRRVAGAETEFYLRKLGKNGSVGGQLLPVRGGTATTHISGDAREGSIALLLYSLGVPLVRDSTLYLFRAKE